MERGFRGLYGGVLGQGGWSLVEWGEVRAWRKYIRRRGRGNEF